MRGSDRRRAPLELPEDFLRLPLDLCVLRKQGYLLVKDLVLVPGSTSTSSTSTRTYTVVLPRNPTLGMSVAESHGHVRVCSVEDRIRCSQIQKGDMLLSVNGVPVAEMAPHSVYRLTTLVKFLRTCPSPVVLHLQKREAQLYNSNTTTSTTSTTNTTNTTSRHSKARLAQIMERARLWQISNSLMVDATTGQLHTTFGSHTSCNNKHDHKHNHNHKPLWGHASLQEAWQRETTYTYTYTAHTAQLQEQEQELVQVTNQETTHVISLTGVKKALSSRILHTFQDGDLPAFTIWVHDVETGHEWYAPLRYYPDFEDLRDATFHTTNDNSAQHLRVQAQVQVEPEPLLRNLGTLLYTTDHLRPDIVDCMHHYQSFLGCENAKDNTCTGTKTTMTTTTITITRGSTWDGVWHSPMQVQTRQVLQRSLQLFTYRLFLLESVQKQVSQFVKAARENSPTLQDIQRMNSVDLKDYSQKALKSIQAAVDQLQDLLLTAFRHEFRAIAQCGLYTCLHAYMTSSGESYFDRLVREAVREQVEIEVYLPLRSTASRLLVNAWRHQDAQVAVKMQALRSRPPASNSNSGCWWNTSESVSRLLKKVASCALPSSKLTALLEASMEISRLHHHQPSKKKPCGADEFLPLLITCIVQAEIERPFALCALLQGLCDPVFRNGEIGYYLASFEAAITHLLELDLAAEESGDL
jgi:Vacuolar sorting protein 9 (VPS9) domain